MYGSQPYGVVRTGQTDIRALFKSKPEDAFIKDISIPAGYGIVPAGTVMGIATESTSRAGMYVPYVLEGLSAGLTTYPGLAYLTSAGLDTTAIYVTMTDSYKFAIGDHLGAGDSALDGASAIDLGAITAIDRTTYSHIALITVTNALTSSVTVAQGGCVWIQTLITAPFTYAKGILAGGVDTGEGENSKGGAGNLVLGNAVLYKGALYGYNSDSKTDLDNVEDGNLIYLK